MYISILYQAYFLNSARNILWNSGLSIVALEIKSSFFSSSDLKKNFSLPLARQNQIHILPLHQSPLVDCNTAPRLVPSGLKDRMREDICFHHLDAADIVGEWCASKKLVMEAVTPRNCMPFFARLCLISTIVSASHGRTAITL